MGRYATMKIFVLLLTLIYSSVVRADSYTLVSKGFSFSELLNYGGKVEQSGKGLLQLYRVSLEKFEKCDIENVVLVVSENEKTILKVTPSSVSGWYEFSVPNEGSGESEVYLQIKCKVGIPYRNYWL